MSIYIYAFASIQISPQINYPPAINCGETHENPQWIFPAKRLATRGIFCSYRHGTRDTVAWCDYPSIIWLVVWNIWMIFPYIGNFIIPTDSDELIFFSLIFGVIDDTGNYWLLTFIPVNCWSLNPIISPGLLLNSPNFPFRTRQGGVPYRLDNLLQTQARAHRADHCLRSAAHCP